ncbi:MAG: restriction endonuclease subunit S [Mongoliitalea sp.]
MKWETAQLADKTSYIKRGVSPKYVENSGFVILNQKCIRDNRIDYSPSRFTDSQKTYPKDKILKKGDILINSTGRGTLGRTAQIKADLEETQLVDTHITIVRAKDDVDPFFLGHLIRRNEPLIESLGKGSTQQLELSRTDLGEIKLSFPPLPTQRKIASILSAYDDLIENNLKRIKLLEEKARLMFIDLINSEKTAEIILGDLAGVLKRGVSPSYVEDDGIVVLNQKCIRDHLISYEPSRLTNPEKKISPERFLNKFDTLINSTGTGTLGRIAINIQDEFISTVDSHVTIVRANNLITPLYLGQCLFYFEKAIENMGKGSTNQIELSAKELGKELKIPLVKHNLMVDFDNSVRPNFELIWNLQKQNSKLREARDILLPKLMNGQIEV